MECCNMCGEWGMGFTARKYDSAHSARRASFASAMPVSVMYIGLPTLENSLIACHGRAAETTTSARPHGSSAVAAAWFHGKLQTDTGGLRGCVWLCALPYLQY